MANPRRAAASAAAQPDPSGPRVLKKYPNRRLYDTQTSSYITLSDVKRMVMEGEPFEVRDAKSAEDLTRSILLQIILEEEAGGAPMFSEAVLANIIRFYGHAMQGFVGHTLEKNMQSFTDLQKRMTEQYKGVTPEAWAHMLNMQNPVVQGMMGSYMEQSRSLFESMQQQMQKQTEQMLGAFGVKR